MNPAKWLTTYNNHNAHGKSLITTFQEREKSAVRVTQVLHFHKLYFGNFDGFDHEKNI
jgi:hypothetical protein